MKDRGGLGRLKVMLGWAGLAASELAWFHLTVSSGSRQTCCPLPEYPAWHPTPRINGRGKSGRSTQIKFGLVHGSNINPMALMFTLVGLDRMRWDGTKLN